MYDGSRLLRSSAIVNDGMDGWDAIVVFVWMGGMIGISPVTPLLSGSRLVGKAQPW